MTCDYDAHKTAEKALADKDWANTKFHAAERALNNAELTVKRSNLRWFGLPALAILTGAGFAVALIINVVTGVWAPFGNNVIAIGFIVFLCLGLGIFHTIQAAADKKSAPADLKLAELRYTDMVKELGVAETAFENANVVLGLTHA